uniref:Methyl-CpG binding domain protein 1b n=1 Tax=Labrus bergylta TaxID=56723 RepID=A0A3Q3MTH6_9LABR
SMNEEPLESPVPDREPGLKDAGQNPEKKSIAENTCEAALAPESLEDAGQNPEKSDAENTSEAATAPESLKDAGRNPEKKSNAENISEAAPAPESSACLDLSEPKKKPTSDTAEEISGETKEDAKSTAGEPPVDWFEPLEDDDEANSDGELESLAGESERSEVMASGEKTRSHPDEGWSEWPMLGEGWKRKEVVRRSGSSIGQKDVYYLSPRGDRVRSRVELTTVLVGQLDLSNFDYKSGKFYDGEAGFEIQLNKYFVYRKCLFLQSQQTFYIINYTCKEFCNNSCFQWHKKRKRRSCGECKACLCRKDCGTCDFCIDKPKFGGSNKKRQKCRLRQCQRQAMRHLLPFQMGQGDFGADGTMLPGRPRPHYTYSRKSSFKKGKGPQLGYDLSDDDDDSFQSVSSSSFEGLNFVLVDVLFISLHTTHQHTNPSVDLTLVMFEVFYLLFITQICSLADNTAGSGADMENQLMKLLHSLRTSVLPILWSAIMVEGPQLQLIQCSKQSSMTDTMVLIDPDFCYQVTVQKQPLLPTHPLYDCYPTHLSSLTEVVNLLLRLEQYVVCRGLPPKDPSSNKDPLILERASTCDFLVKKNVSICANCRTLQGL